MSVKFGKYIARALLSELIKSGGLHFELCQFTVRLKSCLMGKEN